MFKIHSNKRAIRKEKFSVKISRRYYGRIL